MKNFLAVVLTLMGCGGKNNASSEVCVPNAGWDETTQIEYRYGDSSVAPDYHRSYTITVTDTAKKIVVDSYGKVVLTKHYSNTPSDFQAFKAELSEKGIKKHKNVDNGPCDGGTSETLRLYKGEELVFNAYVYHCSGESGTLHIPYGAADFIRSQIPENVDSLINSTIN